MQYIKIITMVFFGCISNFLADAKEHSDTYQRTYNINYKLPYLDSLKAIFETHPDTILDFIYERRNKCDIYELSETDLDTFAFYFIKKRGKYLENDSNYRIRCESFLIEFLYDKYRFLKKSIYFDSLIYAFEKVKPRQSINFIIDDTSSVNFTRYELDTLIMRYKGKIRIHRTQKESEESNVRRYMHSKYKRKISAQLKFDETFIYPIKNDTVDVTFFNSWKTYPVDTLKDEEFRHEIYVNDVGKVSKGKYQSAILQLFKIIRHEPCKHPSCDQPGYDYYLKMKDSIYLVSHAPISKLYKNWFITQRLHFKERKLNLSTSNFIIRGLIADSIISSNRPRQTLHLKKYHSIQIGKPDTNVLNYAFSYKSKYPVFVTKPKKSFVSKNILPYSTQSDLIPVSLEQCQNEQCYITNQFFLFRPDGTFLVYSYIPDISLDKIHYTSGNRLADYKYTPITTIGCQEEIAAENSVLSDEDIPISELIGIGTINEFKDTLYILPESSHLNRYVKSQYLAEAEKWRNTYNLKNLLSVEEFDKNIQLFFWRDPFNRMILFKNSDLNPPSFCEPIIYLYPVKTKEIDISVHLNGIILNSNPKYQNKWSLKVKPDGNIIDKKTNWTYDYLFWEGYGTIIPKNDSGFCLKSIDVEPFFKEKLKLIGLNEAEIKDFINAWLPSFNSDLYYFISFYSKKIIDKLAPLKVTPAPDTEIRVLMDYEPTSYCLDKPIQILSKPPIRKGFTVVEWGGLKRYHSYVMRRD